jgi:Domain of unknown function (DUF4286)
MFVYEITAVVRADLVEKYEKYMRERHIPDLLETGYFRAASISRAAKNRYRIRYEARDQNALDEYLKNDAARLRADFLEHFPEGAEVSRDVWEVLESWKKS